MDMPQEVELNFFYLHWRDAHKLAEWAEQEKTKLRSLYARHTILSCVFAVEAMTNKIYSDFYLLPTGRKSVDKLSIREKVFAAPLVCGLDKPIGRTFDQSKEPYQSFSELVDIRNWLVHPKGGTYLPARRFFGGIYIADTGEEVPWLETAFGPIWPHTRIPVNPFELTGAHARQALDCTRDLIEDMKRLFANLLTDKWFDEIGIRTEDGTYKEIITVQSLWGGYTPDPGSSPR
jgi:hypothetical protein